MNHASRLVCTCLLAGCALSLSAQDEGAIVKRERIDKSKGIFLNFGPSFTLGKNIGDYSTGFNVELGFLKRLNRVLSIGPSVSYQSFMYDPEVTTAKAVMPTSATATLMDGARSMHFLRFHTTTATCSIWKAATSVLLHCQ